MPPRSHSQDEPGAAAPHHRCPFCGSHDTEEVSLFASQLLMSSRRCLSCRSYFEAVRDEFWSDPSIPETDDPTRSPDQAGDPSGRATSTD